MFTKGEIIALYNNRAGYYDISANLYHLLGFREYAYRRKAISALNLRQGDTVVELGCGTGLNFPLLYKKVSKEGQIIGVDINARMLEKAKQRALISGWNNILLVQKDISEYELPNEFDGVLSTFALTLIPNYGRIIQNIEAQSKYDKNLVVLDLKQPDKLPLWLVKLGVALTKPFGVSLDLADRHPWEIMRKHFHNVSIEELYFGFTYVACVTKKK